MKLSRSTSVNALAYSVVYIWFVQKKVYNIKSDTTQLLFFRSFFLNPCPAELFQFYFSSFEAGIVTQFQLQMTKNIDIFQKYTSSKLSYFTNWASTTNCIVHFSDILFGLKYDSNRIYPGLAGQGLTDVNSLQANALFTSAPSDAV